MPPNTLALLVRLMHLPASARPTALRLLRRMAHSSNRQALPATLESEPVTTGNSFDAVVIPSKKS